MPRPQRKEASQYGRPETSQQDLRKQKRVEDQLLSTPLTSAEDLLTPGSSGAPPKSSGGTSSQGPSGAGGTPLGPGKPSSG